MGEFLINYYKNKTKKEYKIAFFVTFTAVILVHIYKFTNNLPNHDSLYNVYTDQNVLGSGRWALSFACGVSSYFNLPWVIGLLSAVYIGLTASVITSVFELKNPIVIAISGCLLASSTPTTETFFFLYTADGYMLAMFLASLCVLLTRVGERKIYKYAIATVLVAVVCGIYQAYVSFALVLALCYFVDVLLKGEKSRSDCLRYVACQAAVYIVGLVLYYVIWKMALKLTGIPVNNYQGISEVGSINLSLITSGIVNTIKSVAYFYLQRADITLFGVLNVIFLVSLLTIVITAVIKSGIIKRKWAFLLMCLSLIAIFPCVCMWYFASTTVKYGLRMLESIIVLYIFAAILYERWGRMFSKNIVGTLLAIIIFNNALIANISYFQLDRCYERTYAEGVEMIECIHEIQSEYEIKKIAFVGKRQDAFILIDGADSEFAGLASLSSMLEKSLMFDAEHTYLFLKNTFGLDLEQVSADELEIDQIDELPCIPDHNAYLVADDTLVIKLSGNNS